MEARQRYSPPKSQARVTPQERTPSNFPDSCALKDRRGLFSDYTKPALKEKVAANQFGTITGSFTVMVLINMVCKWLEATDGSCSGVSLRL